MYIIYKHTLLTECEHNGWSYIGLTKQQPNKRWKNGLGYFKPSNPTQSLFWNAIQKYGWDSFSHEIIEEGIQTLEIANLREQYWIAYYHTYIEDSACRGYNMTPGGEVHELSDSTRKKLSEVKKGHHVSDETKNKISAAKKGKPSPLKGKKLTSEHKNKLSIAHRGVALSPEHVEALGRAHIGLHQSDESRLKTAAAQEGSLNHNFGKHLSQEVRQKLSKANTGKTPWNAGKTNIKHFRAVVQLTMGYQFVSEYKSITEAKRYTKITALAAVCRGDKIAAGGYRWMYKEDYENWKELQDENCII